MTCQDEERIDRVKVACLVIGIGVGGLFGHFYGENAGVAMCLVVTGVLFGLRILQEEKSGSQK